MAKKKAPTKASTKKAAKKSVSKAAAKKSATKSAVKKTAKKKTARVSKEIGKKGLPAIATPGVVKREKKEAKIPANMTSNEALVGKGKRATVPVRTGVAGGRPGGGGTGEYSPTSDTAAGRGYGKKRKKR